MTLREYIPPKQGLRRLSDFSPEAFFSLTLREYIPPKQGLRHRCQISP